MINFLCVVQQKGCGSLVFFSVFTISAKTFFVHNFYTDFYYFISHCVLSTLLLRNCCETCASTWLNVVPDNADVFISIRPSVFMPEANHMPQLMHHNAKLVTVFPNGYGLRAPSTATHIGTAPVNQQPDTQKTERHC